MTLQTSGAIWGAGGDGSARLPKGKTATLNVSSSTLCAVVYLYSENRE